MTVPLYLDARTDQFSPSRRREKQDADLVTIIDPDGRVRYVTPSVERLLGHRPDQIVGSDALEVIHPDDQPRLIAAINNGDSGSGLELRMRHRDGSWPRMSVTLGGGAHDPGTFGFVLSATRATNSWDWLRAEEPAATPHGAFTDLIDRVAEMAQPEAERDLRLAIEQDQLRLLYQPTVNLKTGAIRGVEALVRWEHPRCGMLSPASFIPLAEETGLVVDLGRWVLREACRQAQQWQRESVPGRVFSVGVNVSPQELQRPTLIREVADVLQASSLDPSVLTLEITETAMFEDADATSRALQGLRRLGVRLALDDFGTGYSSLSYLRHFPVDTLKIDRSFVQELDGDANCLAIVRAVISLAHALHMEVTAEGFETATQLARLRDAYCDHGQGYYFARPLQPDQIGRLLAAT